MTSIKIININFIWVKLLGLSLTDLFRLGGGSPLLRSLEVE